MTDIVDTQTRSRMMSAIRAKDTIPELALRKALHARGFRFRLQTKEISGRPDLLLPRYRAVILVHGCFWHRHAGCRFTTTPATRAEFWTDKFGRNVVRDRQVRQLLFDSGWRIATVWECVLRKPLMVAAVVELLGNWLGSGSQEIEVGEKDI